MHHYTYDENNVFAKILRGELPAKKVYEDEYVLAFNDINPLAPIHILVIPKSRFVTLGQMADEGIKSIHAAFIRAIGKIAIEQGLEKDGYRVIMNNGPNGGQEVQHLHAHILAGEKIGPMRIKK